MIICAHELLLLFSMIITQLDWKMEIIFVSRLGSKWESTQSVIQG